MADVMTGGVSHAAGRQVSECYLDTKLEQTAIQHLNRLQPVWSVRRIERENGARVEGVVDIELPFDPRPAYLHGLRQAEIELIDSWLEQRLRCDQIDGDSGCGTCRQ